ncbi:ABC transporter ATP-binding protein/permease, partial [bacterium]|nr:ABC transporter ATP-binding protein/permease [bacterium]
FMAIISPFAKYYSLRLSNLAASESGRSWASLLSRKFCEADFNKIRETTASECITTMTTNLDQSVFFLQNYLNRIYSAINITAIFAYVLITNWLLLFPILLIGSTYFLFSRFIPTLIKTNASIYLKLQSEIVQNAKSIYEGNREIRTGKMSAIVSKEVSNNFLSSKRAWFKNQELLQFPKFAIDSVIYLMFGSSVYLVILNGRGIESSNLLSVISMSFIVMVKIAAPLQQLYASNGLLKTYRESFFKICRIVMDYSELFDSSKINVSANSASYVDNTKKALFPIKIIRNNEPPIVFNEGSIVGITGKSGAGKSTLIDCMIGFTHLENVKVSYGELSNTNIIIEESYGHSKVGYCPQSPFIFNGSLKDNIFCKGYVNNEEKYYLYLIHLLSLQHLLGKNITSTSLSGGEMQRIALVRELLKRPKFLFLDECTSALDTYNRGKVLEEIIRTHQDRCLTVFVDHNKEVLKACDHVFTIKA